MTSAKLIIKISVYLETNVFSFIKILFQKISSMKMKINRWIQIYAFDFQETKRVGQSIYVLTF